MGIKMHYQNGQNYFNMKLADYIIDVGPDGGTKGGEIVFTGTPEEMLEKGTTITAKYLRK